MFKRLSGAPGGLFGCWLGSLLGGCAGLSSPAGRVSVLPAPQRSVLSAPSWAGKTSQENSQSSVGGRSLASLLGDLGFLFISTPQSSFASIPGSNSASLKRKPPAS